MQKYFLNFLVLIIFTSCHGLDISSSGKNSPPENQVIGEPKQDPSQGPNGPNGPTVNGGQTPPAISDEVPVEKFEDEVSFQIEGDEPEVYRVNIK